MADREREKQSRHQYDLIVILLLGTVALACGWVYSDFVQDDAFITYRYAENIASGRGFVYNLDEAVLGTTTPLYTLWLALLRFVSGWDVRSIGHWISIVSLWIGGVSLYYLGKGDGVLLASGVSVVFVSNPLLVSSVGMETCFLNAIILLALTSYVRGKTVLSGVVLGLSMLTRYETVLLALILGGHYLVRRRRIPFWLISTAALFSVWAIYAWRAFGSVIPQSTAAKLVAETGYPFPVGAIIWWRIYADEQGWYDLVLPTVLFGFYAILRGNVMREKGYRLVLVWTGVYFAGASLVAGSFPWYYGPLMPGLSILLIGGLSFQAALLELLLRRLCATKRLAHLVHRGALLAIATALVGLQLSSWATGWVTYEGRVVDRRLVVYRELTDWLNVHGSSHDTIAAAEIGVLGYYTEMRIIDLYGLVSPALMPWSARDLNETVDTAVELYAPDYIVAHTKRLDEFLERFPEYVPVQGFGSDVPVLFERIER